MTWHFFVLFFGSCAAQIKMACKEANRAVFKPVVNGDRVSDTYSFIIKLTYATYRASILTWQIPFFVSALQRERGKT